MDLSMARCLLERGSLSQEILDAILQLASQSQPLVEHPVNPPIPVGQQGQEQGPGGAVPIELREVHKHLSHREGQGVPIPAGPGAVHQLPADGERRGRPVPAGPGAVHQRLADGEERGRAVPAGPGAVHERPADGDRRGRPVPAGPGAVHQLPSDGDGRRRPVPAGPAGPGAVPERPTDGEGRGRPVPAGHGAVHQLPADGEEQGRPVPAGPAGPGAVPERPADGERRGRPVSAGPGVVHQLAADGEERGRPVPAGPAWPGALPERPADGEERGRPVPAGPGAVHQLLSDGEGRRRPVLAGPAGPRAVPERPTDGEGRGRPVPAGPGGVHQLPADGEGRGRPVPAGHGAVHELPADGEGRGRPVPAGHGAVPERPVDGEGWGRPVPAGPGAVYERPADGEGRGRPVPAGPGAVHQLPTDREGSERGIEDQLAELGSSVTEVDEVIARLAMAVRNWCQAIPHQDLIVPEAGTFDASFPDVVGLLQVRNSGLHTIALCKALELLYKMDQSWKSHMATLEDAAVQIALLNQRHFDQWSSLLKALQHSSCEKLNRVLDTTDKTGGCGDGVDGGVVPTWYIQRIQGPSLVAGRNVQVWRIYEGRDVDAWKICTPLAFRYLPEDSLLLWGREKQPDPEHWKKVKSFKKKTAEHSLEKAAWDAMVKDKRKFGLGLLNGKGVRILADAQQMGQLVLAFQQMASVDVEHVENPVIGEDGSGDNATLSWIMGNDEGCVVYEADYTIPLWQNTMTTVGVKRPHRLSI